MSLTAAPGIPASHKRLAQRFAENEYKDYVTYRGLAGIETVPQFKKILEQLVGHEFEDFNF